MSKTDLFLQSISRRLTGKRISGGLITLSSAAIFAVYAAGYEQTKEAADRFEQQSAHRPASFPIPVVSEETAAAPVRDDSESNRPLKAEFTTPLPATVPSAGREVAVPSNADSSPVASNSAVTANVASASTLVESTEIPSTKPIEVTPVSEPVAVASVPRAVEPAAPAPAPIPAPAPPPPAVRQSLYKDGTYEGWGTSRHGDIGVSVVIQDGRIASAVIAQCRTRYPCSWISQLPGQVVSRQSPNVDYVSGATQSVDAYYTAVVEALSRAK
jgi:uncharacterized protein with FMN-binding domain